MDPDFERRLVQRIQAGDESAFDLIHEAYRHRLFAFLCRLTGSRDTAEDLLEETWIRVVRSLDTLRDETRLGGWLFAVARNVFLSYRRSRAFALESSVDSALLDDMVDPRPSPFECAAASETDRRLERGLAALPIADREVLLLVGVHGLTPTEAADVCGLRADAIRQRLLRARGRLASWLRDQDEAGRPADGKDDRRDRRASR